MDEQTRTDAQARLKRIAGQVAGVQRMVEEGRYCVEVLLQVAAVQAALAEAGRVILSGHFEAELREAARSRDEKERRKRMNELVHLFSRFCRIEAPPADGASAARSVSEHRSRGRPR